MKLIYLPLEELPERYTEMLNAVVKPYADHYLYPSQEDNYYEIKTGQFLDVFKTIQFKSEQMKMVSKLFQEGEVENGDVFYIPDIFFPGVESIRYMSELQGIKVKIYGYNHAGRADPEDFVQNLGKRADLAEASMMKVCDKIFCGSEFHRKLILEKFSMGDGKVIATGAILDTRYFEKVLPYEKLERNEFIINPQRLSQEKGVKEFRELAQTEYLRSFLVTTGNERVAKVRQGELGGNVKVEYRNKSGYYERLSTASLYISLAKQETYGYTIREAIYYGCPVLAPNDLSYREFLPKNCLYDGVEELRQKISNGKFEQYIVPRSKVFEENKNWLDIYNVIMS